ncbi:MAG TPA: hypothetical protein VIY28_19300 [Pseudonocardiaceae bacterium]
MNVRRRMTSGSSFEGQFTWVRLVSDVPSGVPPAVRPLMEQPAELLGQVRGSDVIDAAVVLLAGDDDLILTSDPDDLLALAAASCIHVEIVPV